MAYKEVKKTEPPQNRPLKTKIVDADGKEHNKAILVKSKNLWWLPDMSMYVYYNPTHWDYTD